MEQSLVSVVIPVYNGKRFLRQAIDSVLGQTHSQVEVIAIDDGSTDKSAESLAEYGNRIQLHRQSNCGNVGIVRNEGIKRSRGEFVAFLDQDDWWEPTKLARQVDWFRSDDRIGLVHTAVRFHDDNLACEVGPQNPDSRPQDLNGDCFDRLLMGNGICNSSVAVRRTVLEAVGGCDPDIAGNTVQDYDLWLRIARQSRLEYADERLTNFRLHAGQGHKDRRAMLQAEIHLLRQWSKQEPDQRWQIRTRLGQLQDELAVACLEMGKPWDARRNFGRAMLAQPNGSRCFRFAASCLPYAMVQWVRERKSTGRPES